MSDTPKLDGQISMADHREAMRMAAVGYVRDLAAMTQERDTIGTVLDDVAALFFNEAAWDYADVPPRAAQAITELAEARRQVAVLVSMAMFAPCAHCAAKDFCDNQPAATPCEENIAAWAAQQAKEGGK